MAQAFLIAIDGDEALRALAELTRGIAHPAPLMQDIGRALGNITEDAFQEERSPDGVPWEPLTPKYVLRPRAKAGKSGGRGGDANPILQLTGQMAGSVTHGGDDRSAWVGVAKRYAAIHQFGGTSSMAPGPAAIPARPFLPVSNRGELAESARAKVLAIVSKYLEGR